MRRDAPAFPVITDGAPLKPSDAVLMTPGLADFPRHHRRGPIEASGAFEAGRIDQTLSPSSPTGPH